MYAGGMWIQAFVYCKLVDCVFELRTMKRQIRPDERHNTSKQVASLLDIYLHRNDGIIRGSPKKPKGASCPFVP